MAMHNNIVYSVRIKRGPDILHYDLYFENDVIKLKYLGEYWESIRPLRGLQRSMDLLLYKINKMKNRQRSLDKGYDILIRYCDIKEYDLRSPVKRLRKQRLGGRTIIQEDIRSPRLILVLRDGRRFEIEFSPKVYELVKRLVKKYIEERLRKC